MEFAGEITRTRKSFRNPDRSRTDVLSMEAVRFPNAAGRWQDIDLRPVSGAGQRRHHPGHPRWRHHRAPPTALASRSGRRGRHPGSAMC
jgi:hypothetical protein